MSAVDSGGGAVAGEASLPDSVRAWLPRTRLAHLGNVWMRHATLTSSVLTSLRPSQRGVWSRSACVGHAESLTPAPAQVSWTGPIGDLLLRHGNLGTWHSVMGSGGRQRGCTFPFGELSSSPGAGLSSHCTPGVPLAVEAPCGPSGWRLQLGMG